MSFGIIHRFKGGTQEQYENSIAAVHPGGGKGLPKGQSLHVAGPTADGWLIMAVHDSQASWEEFRDTTLLPGLPQVANGLSGPPDESSFEVYKLQTG